MPIDPIKDLLYPSTVKKLSKHSIQYLDDFGENGVENVKNGEIC
tara:strand:- start:165 stop:296 length:132 start_codon:yes stop_codon:yes gene_type:complete